MLPFFVPKFGTSKEEGGTVNYEEKKSQDDEFVQRSSCKNEKKEETFLVIDPKIEKLPNKKNLTPRQR